MSQTMWGNKDEANNSPLWGPVHVMLTPNTANRDNLFNNTTANAFVTNTAFSTGYIAGVFGVSAAEMSDLTQGQVANVTVTAAGSGYTVRPTLTFEGGGGSGATAQATAKLVSATVYLGGSGYANGEVVTINTTGAVGATATANVNILTTNSTGGVLTISINTVGSFTTLPTAIANNRPTGGSGTTLALNLSFGVAAVTMTANGNNYTSAPTVVFAGAGGTGSEATAALLSEQSKVPAAGWNLRKVLPNGRVQYECLVAMGSIVANSSSSTQDDSLLPGE